MLKTQYNSPHENQGALPLPLVPLPTLLLLLLDATMLVRAVTVTLSTSPRSGGRLTCSSIVHCIGLGQELGSPTVVVVDLSMVLDTPLLRSKRLIALLASRSKSIRVLLCFALFCIAWLCFALLALLCFAKERLCDSSGSLGWAATEHSLALV